MITLKEFFESMASKMSFMAYGDARQLAKIEKILKKCKYFGSEAPSIAIPSSSRSKLTPKQSSFVGAMWAAIEDSMPSGGPEDADTLAANLNSNLGLPVKSGSWEIKARVVFNEDLKKHNEYLVIIGSNPAGRSDYNKESYMQLCIKM